MWLNVQAGVCIDCVQHAEAMLGESSKSRTKVKEATSVLIYPRKTKEMRPTEGDNLSCNSSVSQQKSRSHHLCHCCQHAESLSPALFSVHCAEPRGSS